MKLMSPTNIAGSYFVECQMHGLILSNEDLEMYVTEYTQRNLLATDHTYQLINMILQKVAIIRDRPMEAPNIDQQTVEGPTHTRMLEKMAEFRIW